MGQVSESWSLRTSWCYTLLGLPVDSCCWHRYYSNPINYSPRRDPRKTREFHVACPAGWSPGADAKEGPVGVLIGSQAGALEAAQDLVDVLAVAGEPRRDARQDTTTTIVLAVSVKVCPLETAPAGSDAFTQTGAQLQAATPNPQQGLTRAAPPRRP